MLDETFSLFLSQMPVYSIFINWFWLFLKVSNIKRKKNAIRYKADIKLHFPSHSLPVIRVGALNHLKSASSKKITIKKKKTFYLSQITMLKILSRHFCNALYFIWIILFTMHSDHCRFSEFPRCKILEIYSSFKNSFYFKQFVVKWYTNDKVRLKKKEVLRIRII